MKNTLCSSGKQTVPLPITKAVAVGRSTSTEPASPFIELNWNSIKNGKNKTSTATFVTRGFSGGGRIKARDVGRSR